MGSVHESQRDLMEACRQAREDAEAVEYRAEEDMRRLSYTETFMRKMKEGMEEVKRSTFKDGSESHSKWEDLRSAFRIKRQLSTKHELQD